MDKKDKKFHHNKSTLPDTLLESEPESLKDNPDGETICSPYFSSGCINEDTNTPAPNQEGDENEKY